MRKAILLLTFLMHTLLSSAQSIQKQVPTDNPLKTKLDSLVDQSVAPFMKSSSRVGLSIGIIKDGKPYHYNYGSTQKDKSELPTGNTVYELASITKTFGSTLLAKAVLDKKAGLNDDIRKYLKEAYPNLNYNGTPLSLIHI
nr:serine hydrolase [Pedobacter sp. ASV19]